MPWVEHIAYAVRQHSCSVQAAFRVYRNIHGIREESEYYWLGTISVASGITILVIGWYPLIWSTWCKLTHRLAHRVTTTTIYAIYVVNAYTLLFIACIIIIVIDAAVILFIVLVSFLVDWSLSFRPFYLSIVIFTFHSPSIPTYPSIYSPTYLPIHLLIYIPTHSSTQLSTYPSIYSPTYLPHLPTYLSYLPHLPTYLPIHLLLPAHPSTHLSMHLLTSLPTYPSIYSHTYLSIHLLKLTYTSPSRVVQYCKYMYCTVRFPMLNIIIIIWSSDHIWLRN